MTCEGAKIPLKEVPSNFGMESFRCLLTTYTNMYSILFIYFFLEKVQVADPLISLKPLYKSLNFSDLLINHGVKRPPFEIRTAP